MCRHWEVEIKDAKAVALAVTKFSKVSAAVYFICKSTMKLFLLRICTWHRACARLAAESADTKNNSQKSVPYYFKYVKPLLSFDF